MALVGRVAICLSLLKSLETDSCRICANDRTMTIENARVPRGCSRRRPTGYRLDSLLDFHDTSFAVPKMMSVTKMRLQPVKNKETNEVLTQKIQSRISQRGQQGEGAGEDGGNCFCYKQEDIRRDIDVDRDTFLHTDCI